MSQSSRVPHDFGLITTVEDSVMEDLVVQNLTSSQDIKHQRELSLTLTSNTNLVRADAGKRIYTSTDGVVITLPASAVGLTYTIVNTGDDGEVEVKIDLDSADQFSGAGVTPLDGKQMINTKATAKKGDSITVSGDGSTGWVIQRQVGTWNREA